MSFLIPNFASNSLGGANSAEPFPCPFADYASTAMPTSFTDALKWCWVPGTPIELADLSLKAIEDIRPGDSVLNKDGQPGRVVQCSRRPVTETICNITVGSFGIKSPLRLTSSHNLFVVRAPRGKKPSELDFSKLPIEKVPAVDISIGDFLLTPLPIEPETPSRCPYDGYIIGMYLAEGCVVYDDERVMAAKFYLGEKDERQGIADRLRSLLEDATGFPQTVYTPPGRPDIRTITVRDPELPGWLISNFPGLARTKDAHRAMQFKRSTRQKILAGWLDGGGSINNLRGVFYGMTGWTTSYTMAYQFQRIAHSLGMTPGLSKIFTAKGKGKYGSKGGGYALHFGKKDIAQLVQWSVKLQQAQKALESFEAQAAGATKSFIYGDYVYRRVTGVAEEYYEGDICNFEVEGEHSYVAGGIASANCEFLILTNGVYRSAIERVISYFITDIEIDGTDRAGKQKYKDYLYDTLGIHSLLKYVALDFLTYGNSICSVIMPFRRHLSCPGCGFEAPLKRIHGNQKFHYSWSGHEFNATCPFCHRTGKWTHVDRRTSEEDDIVVKRWNIHELELVWDPYTEQCGHIWKIPNYYKDHIAKGRLHQLERAPWEVIQACRNNNHLLFDPDVIYHAKEDTLAGVLNKGWGISRVLTNFRQAWYVQVLHRYNEAIGLDYIIPFRVITPEPRQGSAGNGMMTDPLFNSDMGGVTGQINAMLQQRRRDPASWFTLPFPVRYQALGGEASQLAPHELMDQGLDTLLNSIGVPVEFYKGSMSLQSAPAALRLMESNWSHLTHVLNKFLQWVVDKISIALSWDEVTCRLERPSHADDLNRQLAKLQLMMGQQISQTTGLKSVGLQFEEEQDRLFDEQKYVAERGGEVQEEMEQMGLGDQMAQGAVQAGGQPGAAPAGGAPAGAAPAAPGAAPPAPAGGDPAAMGQPGVAQPVDPVEAVLANLPMGDQESVTPVELHQIADTTANQIFALPSTHRISALRRLKSRNEVIHALVKSKLEGLDQNAKRQGQAMAAQAAQGQAQGSAAPPPPM